MSISHITRLGPPPSSSEDKPRPIKLDLTSQEARNKVLRNAKKLEAEVIARQPLGKGIYQSGFDPQGKRSSENGGPGAKGKETSRRSKSDYCEREDCNEKDIRLLTAEYRHTKIVPHSLKCIYTNAQSLRHKMSALLTTVEALCPDIIGITESWGDSDISDSEFSIPGFTMFRSDREVNHRGGGVLLYVRSDINPVETKMKSKFADQVWYKVKITNGKDLLIVCVTVHLTKCYLVKITISFCVI